MTTDARPPAAVGLVLVDLQNAYFESAEMAALKPALIGRANQLVRAAREHARPAVLVRTVHARDRSTWTINMLADGEGFAYPGSDEAAYVADLDTDDAIDVTKTRDDAFHRTALGETLTRLGVTHVLLGGVSTHSCVAETAMAGFAHDFHVAIAGEVIASEDPGLSDAMLAFLTDELRQPVLDQDASLALLREGAGGA